MNHLHVKVCKTAAKLWIWNIWSGWAWAKCSQLQQKRRKFFFFFRWRVVFHYTSSSTDGSPKQWQFHISLFNHKCFRVSSRPTKALECVVTETKPLHWAGLITNPKEKGKKKLTGLIFHSLAGPLNEQKIKINNQPEARYHSLSFKTQYSTFYLYFCDQHCQRLTSESATAAEKNCLFNTNPVLTGSFMVHTTVFFPR